VSAAIRSYGKGRIAAVYFDFGQHYLDAATAVARDYLASLTLRRHCTITFRRSLSQASEVRIARFVA